MMLVRHYTRLPLLMASTMLVFGITPMDGTRAFHDFEQAGWENVAEEYDRRFGELTAQSIVPLLDAAGVAPGVRLLDVACGPGYVAAAAARRHSSVIGIDFSSAMVTLASRQNPDADFRLGDAESLDFPDHSFDAVVMNFGMLHLANPESAISEAFRVLCPGGRYAFTVWDIPERTSGFGIILQAIQRYGNMDVPLPAGPPFFRFSDSDESKRTLTAAGFVNAQTLMVPQIWKLETGDQLLSTFRQAAVRTAALLNAQTAASLENIRQEVIAKAEKFRRGDTIDLPMPAILTSALRPAR
jgi:ubiquinone/menaquinone biosynthesis C-methylase UbiE